MPEKIYRQLSKRLDAIPNGFPSTKSGVELRLLKKIFTPEEAALGTVMRLTLEPADDIAARVGMDSRQVYRTLKGMSRKGLIRFKKGEGQFIFGLMPFVVGIYEEQLSRIDKEFAALFEAYLKETIGTVISEQPAVHRIIPMDKAIPFDLEIFPYEKASEIIESAKSWAVRDCICRVQQRLIGKGCEKSIENCLIFAPIQGVFNRSEVNRVIEKQNALDLLKAAQEEGLVHSTGNYRQGLYYICNCCTCCCGIMRCLSEFGVPTAIAHSDFRAVHNDDTCTGCSTCVEHCPFGALTIWEDICSVDHSRCLGCGLCVTVCPTGSLHLERRSKGETPMPPLGIKDWMVRRADERGISMRDIL